MCLGLMVSGPEELAASNRFVHAVSLCANTVPLASKPCTENFYLNDFVLKMHIIFQKVNELVGK